MLQFPLRTWQEEALDAWEEAGGRGVVEAATGTGKTAIALGAAARLRYIVGPSLRVAVVVPTLALAEQWVRAFSNTLGVPGALIGELHSATHRKVTPRTSVVVTVINTARTELAERVDTWVRSGRTVLLVVDECHRAGSEWNSKVLETRSQHTLGLSATPERTDGGHHTLVYPGIGEPIYRYELRKALDDGVLAPVRSINLYVDFTSEEGAEWTKLTEDLSSAMRVLETQHPDVTLDPTRLWNEISNLARREDPAAIRVVALVAKRRRLVSEADARRRCLASIEQWLIEHRHRAMVFHESIDAAEQVAEELRSLGGNISLDHSKRPRVERDKDLQRFRTDRNQILVAVRSLDEGIDVPDASVAVLAAGTRSRRQRIQRFGRILRPAEQKQAIAISILVRETPEESEVGRQDEELLGDSRVTHHRWPGRSVVDAIDQPSTYKPLSRQLNQADRLTARALGIDNDNPGDPVNVGVAGAGGYVASAADFSLNAWHLIADARRQSGMPPEEFDRLAPTIRKSWQHSLDGPPSIDPAYIYGGEIEAIRRTWERVR